MKLTLDKHKELAILRVSEEVSAKDLEILRAGIQKFFRDGKNKIVIDITNVKELNTPFIREIAILNILAAELAGSVVFAGVNEKFKQKMLAFSKPAAFAYYSSEEEAKNHLAGAPPTDEAAKQNPVSPPSAAAAQGPEAGAEHQVADLLREVELLKRMVLNDIDKLMHPLSDMHAHMTIEGLKKEIQTLTEKLEAPTPGAAGAAPATKPA